jgi:Flp pilus assembly pilin Flp
MKKAKTGQSLVEYLILVCLVALSAIGVVKIVGKNIEEQYANISSALQGGGKVKLTPADPSTYEARGLDNYMDSGAGKGPQRW